MSIGSIGAALSVESIGLLLRRLRRLGGIDRFDHVVPSTDLALETGDVAMKNSSRLPPFLPKPSLLRCYGTAGFHRTSNYP